MRPDLSIRGHRSRTESSPVEFGWRVHTMLEARTAAVDMKASILLAFQGGAFIFAVTSRELALATADRRPALVVVAAMAMLVAAMALAVAAVMPALGSAKRHRDDRMHEWIYFGHVRLWESAELATRLSRLSERDQVRALSAQLVRMSRLNWRKHRLLQRSVVLTMFTMLVMMVAVALWTGI